MESIKEKFHLLIDGIEDENLLKFFYSLMKHDYDLSRGYLAHNLSKSEKSELMQIAKDINIEANLVNHPVILKKYKEWLN